MKMKVISYFLIATALLPTQQVEASWFSNAKNVISSGTKWLTSKLNQFKAQTPVIQKRGILTPHEFSGLHSAFKPQYAHLSPLTGVALMPNFTNLYRHGSPNSAFTKLLNDSKISLFHHNDNGLRPTCNKSIPASSWNPEFLGTLAADIHLNRTQDAKWIDEFTQQCKDSHFKTFGIKPSISRINLTAEALAQSRNEMIDTPERVALYPYYYLPAVPAAMLMHKAKTRDDVATYVRSLDNRMQAQGAESPLKNPDVILNPEKRTVFSGADFAASLQEPLERVVSDAAKDETFETRLAAETDKQLNGLIVPQQVKQQHYGYQNAPAAPNCSEAALQDLCNIILSGSDGTFTFSLLPAHVHPLQAMKDFYTQHKSYTVVNDSTVGQAWMNLVSGHKDITYRRSVNKEHVAKEYEVASFLNNLLRLLNILFGTNAQSYAEFGEQISSEKRHIKADIIEEEKRVRFSISLHNEQIEAFLCVNPALHTWLEVPSREKKDKENNKDSDSWLGSLAKIINSNNTYAQETLKAELLLPQRQNVSFFANIWERFSSIFTPKTVAQATHISYANQENINNQYAPYYKQLLEDVGEKKRYAILTTLLQAEKGKTYSTTIANILFTAAKEGDCKLIEFLAQHNIDFNAKNEFGENALFYPIMIGYLDPTLNYAIPTTIQASTMQITGYKTCELLLKLGTDVHAKSYVGNTPLSYAAMRNQHALCELFIKHGADVNVQNTNGSTPLAEAARTGSKDACKRLLELGADTNIKNKYGLTPLSLAADKGYTEICKLLIEHGADIYIKDDEGNTLLHRAIHDKNIELCKLLIEHRADTNIKNNEGTTPLHFAMERGSIDICKLLFEHNAHVNIKNNEGIPALTMATIKGHIDICKLLIDHGADINAQIDNTGLTALHYTAIVSNNHKSNDICRLLLERGAKVNIKDNNGETPLNIAVKLGFIVISKLLLEHGADANIKDNSGNTPLHRTISESHDNNMPMCKLLLKHGAALEAKNSNDCTPLIIAARKNNTFLCNFLIEQGADVNAKDYCGYTPLHTAIINNNVEMCKLLLERGADVSVQDDTGKTPLGTVGPNRKELRELLIKYGAK